MNNIRIIDSIKEQANKRDKLEYSVGRSGMIPNLPANSGSRIVMSNQMYEQKIPIIGSEVPLYQTGVSSQYGWLSSSFNVADEKCTVIAKIHKYSTMPEHSYILIVRKESGIYDIIEREYCKHITESYGYLYNNTTLDSLKVGDTIKKNTPYKYSTDFDEFYNRKDGLNVNVLYLSTERTKEDAIQISESFSKRCVSPLIKEVEININDNDIPLNLYGNLNTYKTFPDIGEEILNGILIATRREKKEGMLFSQSFERLCDFNIGDTKFTGSGFVSNIEIYCNNPDILDRENYKQIKYYYNEQKRMTGELITVVNSILQSGGKLTYELQKRYHEYSKIYNNVEFMYNKSKFSNILLKFTTVNYKELGKGDKIENSYGGKGVISQVLPDSEMPIMTDGSVVDVIFNQSTCMNRENLGQLFEMSVNYISNKIREYCNLNVLDTDEQIGMLIAFLEHISKKEADFLYRVLMSSDEETKKELLYSFLNDNGGMYISADTISESININTLVDLYKKFSFIKPEHIYMPQVNSMGKIRYVKSRVPVVCSKQYIIRLKQYSEDKCSAVNLSPVDTKNRNVKSKSKKQNKSIISGTCIKFGEMETGNMLHMNPETVVTNLLIQSLSPKGRRCCEKLLIDNPFDINVELSDESVNRSVEILNVYLTVMGLRLKFTKKRRVRKQIIKRKTNSGEKYKLFERKKKQIIKRKTNSGEKYKLFERISERNDNIDK